MDSLGKDPPSECGCAPQARMERTDIGTLLIPNIRAADAGTYLCVGTNAIGSSQAPIEVTVVRGETRLWELASDTQGRTQTLTQL